jgi:hypothetical protein
MKHAAILAALVLGGIGAKLIFFNAPTAEADSLSIKSVRVNVSRLHQSVENLPAQKWHDMSLVFADGD